MSYNIPSANAQQQYLQHIKALLEQYKIVSNHFPVPSICLLESVPEGAGDPVQDNLYSWSNSNAN